MTKDNRPPNRKTSLYVSDAMLAKIGHPEKGVGAAITAIIDRYAQIMADEIANFDTRSKKTVAHQMAALEIEEGRV